MKEGWPNHNDCPLPRLKKLTSSDASLKLLVLVNNKREEQPLPIPTSQTNRRQVNHTSMDVAAPIDCSTGRATNQPAASLLRPAERQPG